MDPLSPRPTALAVKHLALQFEALSSPAPVPVPAPASVPCSRPPAPTPTPSPGLAPSRPPEGLVPPPLPSSRPTPRPPPLPPPPPLVPRPPRPPALDPAPPRTFHQRSARFPSEAYALPLVSPSASTSTVSRSAPPTKACYSQPSTPEDRPFGHRYRLQPGPTPALSPLSPPPPVPARHPPPPPSLKSSAPPELSLARPPPPPSCPVRNPAPKSAAASRRRNSLSLSPTQRRGPPPIPPPPNPPRLRSASSTSSLRQRPPSPGQSSRQQFPPKPPRPVKPPPLPDRTGRILPVGPREWASSQERLVYQATHVGVYQTNITSPPPPPPPRPPIPRQAVAVDSSDDDDDEEYDQNDNEDDGPVVATTGKMTQPLSSKKSVTRTSLAPNDSSIPSGAFGGLSASPSTSTNTLVEEMPDATFANRRPPFLEPKPITINLGSAYGAFAIRGKYLVAGHATLKLYNTYGAAGGSAECVHAVSSLMDVKITALEFKPCHATSSVTGPSLAGPRADAQNRFVWAGTKDGQLFEYDCQERRIVESKSNLHSSSVTKIFRTRTGGMVSLDESCKVQIWSTSSATAQQGVRIMGSSRAQRVADKTSFAAMIGDLLWTSSGPSGNRSASALAQRSPSIRVYDPDPSQAWTVTPRPLTISPSSCSLVNAITIGPVTAGTLIPSLSSKKVYLAHESGHVSVWEIMGGEGEQEPEKKIAFVKVFKVSNYQITAIEGVTRYLWAGLRTGQVYVYDVGDDCNSKINTKGHLSGNGHGHSDGYGGSGWKVLKVWKAHKEAVSRILVDPSFLWEPQEEACKLLVVTTSTDWKVRIWDGTLGSDWLAREMRKREEEFCTYRPIRVLVCSWNVDACRPSDLVGTSDNVNFLEDVLHSCGGGGSSSLPDVIVFGFQEMIDLENKKLTAKTVLLGGRKKGAEKLSDGVSHSYRQWHDRLVAAVRMAMPADEPYVVAHTQNLVGLFTCVFVKASERAKMRDIAMTTVKTGMKGRYGNKGAILARLVVDDSSICFINCHLAAGQTHLRQRHADLIDILEGKSAFPDPPDPTVQSFAYIGGGNGSAIADHEFCFLYGDLNYRIEARREDVIRAIAAGEYLRLLEADQLHREKRNNPGFRLKSFMEAPITFHPTYKYDRGTHMYDSSEKSRVPAWCDRILYRTPNPLGNYDYHHHHQENNTLHFPSSGGGGGGGNLDKGSKKVSSIEPKSYRRYEVNISDHRPISGDYIISIKSIVPGLRRGILNQVIERWKIYQLDLKKAARKYYFGT